MSNYQSAADLAAETIGHLENKFGGPLNEAKARLDELEQKMARGVGGGGINDPNAASWGAQIAGRLTEAKSYFDSRASKGSVSFDVKTIITSGSGSGADLLCLTAM